MGSSNMWQGLDMSVPYTDMSKPVRFLTIEYGVRAQLILLRNYVRSGVDTVRAIVQRWSGLGITSAAYNNYVQYVVSISGLNADKKMVQTDLDAIARLGYAMSGFEAGKIWVPLSIYQSVMKQI
jgi:hypothetical protein